MGLLARMRQARVERQQDLAANQAAERHIQRALEMSQESKWNTAIWELDQAIALATDPHVLGRAHGGAFLAHAAQFDRAKAMEHYEVLKRIDPEAARRLEATPAFVMTSRMGPVIYG